MPAANVKWNLPLNRLNPVYPGQMGVEGGWTETGLRQHCTGAIFYVDPNHPGTSDLRDGTDPNDPFTTVQAALDKCEGYRGDIVVVMTNNNWMYDELGSTTIGMNTAISEQATMDVPGVRLVGLNLSGTSGVPWLNPVDDGTCITVNACNCTIEGFFFHGFSDTNNGTAILATYVSQYGDNLTVKHCVFDDHFEEGIILQFSWMCDIYDNWFLETPTAITNDDAQSPASYNHIHNNYFFDCPTCAIYIGEGQYWTVYENEIWNSDAASGAAAADEMIEVTTGDHNFVHHNTMSCALPAVADGDYDDCNTAGTNDAWVHNYCMDGPSTSNPG